MKIRKVPVGIYFITIISLLAFTLLSMFLVYDATAGKNISGRIGKYFAKVASIPQNKAPQKLKTRVIDTNWFGGSRNYWHDSKFIDTGYILISCFDKQYNQTTIKLLSLRDGQVKYSWKPDLQILKNIKRPSLKHFSPERLLNSQFKTIHPILLSDSSIILKGEYGIFRINKNNEIVWGVPTHFHHSTELDANQNLWIPSIYETPKLYNTIYNDLVDDALTCIDLNGTLLFKKSIAQILIDNGYEYLIHGIGSYEKDALHTNDIEPALYNTKYWKKGDLLVSIKNRSTVLLYRPSNNKIIWLKTGPWMNQHDVNYVGDTAICVFNNNSIKISSAEHKMLHTNNSLVVYSFKTNNTYTPYESVFKTNDIRTPKEGRCKILENGDLFIEESTRGRILRGNNKQLRWVYIEIVDNKHTSIQQWSRYYPKLPWQ